MKFIATMLSERQSIQRPLLFVGVNYPYWKKRMKIFIQSMELDVWNVILNGPHVSYIEVKRKLVIKSRKEWSDRDKKLIQTNYKVYNTLLYALGVSEFNKVSMCENAKQI